ncbi:MFS transporter [Nocardioides convexus]|uniref:MFS transporter n=1 Tax=Nocardioides convexus TaxID=2712224 RepID=UPI0024189A73|nr:MFS transporter [Nocardioides convexus]
MQIPVGLMVDRYGSRTVLTVAVAVVSLGQAAFAFAGDYPTALVARAMVGVGDAMTFICVLRLVTSWFPRGQVPLVSQAHRQPRSGRRAGRRGPDDLGAGPGSAGPGPTSRVRPPGW